MKMVKVSVIIPARNEEEYIASCLDSLMNQTKKPFEIIVVTNNSTDRTREIVDGYRSKGVRQIVFNGKSSAAIARNIGAKAAKGDVFFFFDADMLCSPTVIEDIEGAFSDPSIKHAVTLTATNTGTFLQKCYAAKMAYLRKRWEIENITKRSANIFRKDLFKKVGGYPKDVFYFEDRELWEKVKGYRQGDIKSYTYNNDPGNINEFIRQGRYIGKGLSTYGIVKLLRDNPSLRIVVYSLFILLILLASAILLSSDRVGLIEFAIFIVFAAAIAYGLVRAIVYAIYSKMVIESFVWVFLLAPARIFFIVMEYTKNKLRSGF